MSTIIPNLALVKLKPGHTLEARAPIKKKPFYMVGNGTTNTVGTSMNLIQEMTKMTKPELFMFGLIENQLSYISEYSIGEVKINTSTLTSTEKQYIKIAYPLLRDKSIIVRTRREHYLVNPSLIMPRALDEAEILWMSFTGQLDNLT